MCIYISYVLTLPHTHTHTHTHTHHPHTPTTPHTAIPGVDFTAISAPLTLTPENSVTGERCFDIELLPDDIVEEGLECFTVELSLPEADRQSIILSGGTQICCIQDDDSECRRN